MKSPFRIRSLPVLIFAATGLAACGGGGVDLPFGEVRVVNAISDSSSLDANAVNLPSDINNIAVNTASGFRTVPDGSFNLNLTVNTASSPLGFNFDNVDIDRDAETSVYFPGKVVDGSYDTNGFQVKNALAGIGTGQAEIQTVHAASNLPVSISLYLNAPTDVAIGGTPITVDYKTGAVPAAIASGAYRLRVTAVGSPVVLFDSGPTGVTLAADARLQIAVLNKTDATGAAVGIALLLIPSDDSTAVAVPNVLP